MNSFISEMNLDWHPHYITEYQERLAEKKELDGFVRTGELAEFQESAADQALLVASDFNGFCGVIAGIKSLLYGFHLRQQLILTEYSSSGRKTSCRNRVLRPFRRDERMR